MEDNRYHPSDKQTKSYYRKANNGEKGSEFLENQRLSSTANRTTSGEPQKLQYCAKVMQTKFDEFRSLFSRTFERNFERDFAQFRAKSFTFKRYFVRHFVEISHDISEGQTKNSYCENSRGNYSE